MIGIAFIFFVLNLSLWAQEIVINDIIIKGNKRTNAKVILAEGEIVPGQAYSQEQLEEARIRILNLEIFSTVTLTTVKKKNQHVLEIQVEERWTTIPILKFASGGGVSEFITGLYDVNLFGNYLEAGAQYQRLGARNSGVVWTKIPRLTRKWQLDLQAWRFSRVRLKYDQARDQPLVENGFTQVRDKAFVAFNYRHTYEKIFGFFYEYNGDDFVNDLNVDGLSASNVVLPRETTFHFIGLQATLGRIDIDREFFQGQRLNAMARAGFSDVSSEHFQELTLQYQYFNTLGRRGNVALRSFLGVNNTENLQYNFYFGGLDFIRGFADNRFYGKVSGYTNAEYRHSFFNSSFVTFQAVTFADFITTASHVSDMFKDNALSTGVGIRAFFPKFYRFVLRLDYAKPLEKEDDNNVSFGVQQFF